MNDWVDALWTTFVFLRLRPWLAPLPLLGVMPNTPCSLRCFRPIFCCSPCQFSLTLMILLNRVFSSVSSRGHPTFLTPPPPPPTFYQAPPPLTFFCFPWIFLDPPLEVPPIALPPGYPPSSDSPPAKCPLNFAHTFSESFFLFWLESPGFLLLRFSTPLFRRRRQVFYPRGLL